MTERAPISDAEIEAAAKALYRLAAAEFPQASPWEELRKAKSLYVEQARAALEAARAPFIPTREELDRIRQWYNAVDDLDPNYLEPADTELAMKITLALAYGEDVRETEK